MIDTLPRNAAATALSRVALYDALLSLKTRDEVDAFLADLCTPSELRAFAERWEVAVWANYLADKQHLTDAGNTSILFGIPTAIAGPDRSYGVTLRAKF